MMKRKNLVLIVGFSIFLVWFVIFCSFVFNWKWNWDYFDDKQIPNLVSYRSATSIEYKGTIPWLIYNDAIDQTLNITEPKYFSLSELFKIWPPNDTSSKSWLKSPAYPDKGFGLQRLHYDMPDELALAKKFRENEIPFVLTNLPDMVDVEKAFELKALLRQFGNMPRMVEKSETNYFVYYSVRNLFRILWRYPNWKVPQVDVSMTFLSFLRHAEEAETAGPIAGDRSLHYFNINAGEGYSLPWIREAFHFFTPDKPSFFVVDPEEFRGINCRFGMRGVTAAAHYDIGRNFVAMVKGRKRYILLSPRECGKLSLLPRSHPSGRHTSIDWTDRTQLETHSDILRAHATETVLSAGEILYIPSYWFHFIVSQDASIQCNARSGSSEEGADDIKKCMDHADLEFAPLKKSETSTGHRHRTKLEHTWHFEE